MSAADLPWLTSAAALPAYMAGAAGTGIHRLILDRGLVAGALREYLDKLDWQAWGRAGDVAGLLQARDPKAAEKLRACHAPDSGWLEFCPSDFAHHHKYHPERCWLRICPSCAKALAQRLRVRYAGRIDTVIRTNVYTHWTLKHLVLTVRREGELGAQVAALHKAAKRLYKYFWSDDRRAGAFAALEIGPQGGNVHVHAIVYGRFVPQADLSDHWRALTGNPIVYVRQVDPEQAVSEGIKYCTKFAKGSDTNDFELSTPDLAALHFALKGKRRVWSWGAFYGVDDDLEQDDPPGDVCPQCNHRLAWISRADGRALLHLTRVINCTVAQAPGAPGAGPPLAAGPPS